jgi:hypothetical protein
MRLPPTSDKVEAVGKAERSKPVIASFCARLLV